MNEHMHVLDTFLESFNSIREKPIVIYGLGKNTEYLVSNLIGYNIIGLMDSKSTGETLWGYRVLSEQEVIEIKPVIVIIARESIVPVIYERISYLYKEYGISIYNYRGELLGQVKWKYKNHCLPYWDINEDQIKQAIDTHDIISFDIFDTLLMRRVLQPDDVFHIIERILTSEGSINNNFAKIRIEAEHLLQGYPTIHQIYNTIHQIYSVPYEILEHWKHLEFEIEKKVLVARNKVIEIFNYCLSMNKQVYLISDMYFSKKELEEFLRLLKIEGYKDLFVSCDYALGKDNGSLYEMYKKIVGTGRYLHIGDNRRSDGDMAEKSGIDSFLIYSAYELWMASSMQTSLSHLKTLEQRCILGNLVWKYCENPFVLHESRGMVTITSEYQLGYLFLGSLYTEFIQWLVNKTKEMDLEQLLLPSRDGYLIDKMLENEPELVCKSVYFKTSRRAVTVASLYTIDDIIDLCKRKYTGTFGELLLNKFGVTPKENDSRKHIVIDPTNEDELEIYVKSYSDDILCEAERERKAYYAYLKKIGILNSKRKALFDFVAGGTVQYYLSKLCNEQLQGIYFASMNLPNSYYAINDIQTAFGNITSYGGCNQISKYYLLLETIMIDEYPTLSYIDENNDFVYASNCDSKYDRISKIQEGILAYQKDMNDLKSNIDDWHVELEFSDELFGMLFLDYCSVSKDLKSIFTNDDLFNGVGHYSIWK